MHSESKNELALQAVELDVESGLESFKSFTESSRLT